MASLSRQFKDALVTILQSVTRDGEPAFVEVKGYPFGEFDGYPSLRILPGDQTNTEATMKQNNRAISFIARTYVQATENTPDAYNDLYDQIYDLTDGVLSRIDQADENDELAVEVPGTHAWMLTANRGDWFEADTQAGPSLFCDINIEVTYSKDN